MSRRRAGMTLMELVIGLVITSLMAAAGTASLNTLIDHRQVIRTATSATERAAALRETLRSWLLVGTVQIQGGGVPNVGRAGAGRQTAPISASAAQNASVSAAASTGHELTFTTTAPTPAMAPSVRIRLFVDADQNTPERGLTIEYQASTQMPLQRRELEPSIGDLEVEFLDARTNRWYDATEAGTIQPTAVRLQLEPLEHETLPALLTLPFIFPIGQRP